MIDFNGNGIFARLKKVNDQTFSEIVNEFLIEDEKILGTYQSVRDGVVFTTKRIITINVQAIAGKKQDFTSIPYSKITTYSLETAGGFDLDSELEIYVSAVGRVKFQFIHSANVKEICAVISAYALG